MSDEDLVIEKELVFGHLSRRLAKPMQDKTHQWEIFLYSATGEDLTRWVDHVTFHLHSSFEKPNRELRTEPYRVSEYGWGEFEAQIEVVPKDAISFTLIHLISFPQQGSKKPALVERKHEKIIFRNPSPILYEGLSSAPFAWNKIKREKKHKLASDVEVSDQNASDPYLEKKWMMEMIAGKSKQIRREIAELSQEQKEQRSRIMNLIDKLELISPDLADTAKLFL